ncbi:MAG: DUF3391 domain-containing protein [Nitrospira sp.]
MPYRPITIDALRIGMHVAKLDVAWFRSPFMRHSFLIRTDEQIQKLRRAGVTHLSIDPARGLDLQDSAAPSQQPLPAAAQSAPSHTEKPAEIRSLATMTQELLTARSARAKLEESVHTAFSRIAKTGIVDPEEASHTVHAISAVAQALNTHALFMALSQGREANAPLSQHALATCSFSMILAHAAGYNLLAIQELATGALLHDIGLCRCRQPSFAAFTTPLPPSRNRTAWPMRPMRERAPFFWNAGAALPKRWNRSLRSIMPT